MFCCSDTSQRVEKPQPPLFPDQNLKPRSETTLLFAATLAAWGLTLHYLEIFYVRKVEILPKRYCGYL